MTTPHKHQWRFHGSKPVEPATSNHGFISAVKARRIYFRSCIVCDPGKKIRLAYETHFFHGRWVGQSTIVPLEEVIGALDEHDEETQSLGEIQ